MKYKVGDWVLINLEGYPEHNKPGKVICILPVKFTYHYTVELLDAYDYYHDGIPENKSGYLNLKDFVKGKDKHCRWYFEDELLPYKFVLKRFLKEKKK